MADTAPAMLWVTEPGGRASFVSRGWYEFTGQTGQESLGKDGFGWLEAVHTDDCEEARRVFLEADKKGVPFTLDYRVRLVGGAYRWVIDAGRPRFDEAGAFLGYIGSVIDITERRESEQALRESRERLASILDTTIDGIITIDDDQRIVLFNVAAEKIFVPLRQKCVITGAICASQKIADNEGLNMIENRQCLERASESIVKNHGRSRQDSEN